MTEPFRMIELTLSGSPRERGRIHGEGVRTQIREILTILDDVLLEATGLDLDTVFQRMRAQAGFLDAATRWTPTLVDEVHGIAEGADLPGDTLLGFQCLQEADWFCKQQLAATAPVFSCTTIGCSAPDGPTILAQTADNPPWIMGRQVLLHIDEEETGIRSHVLTFPGIVGIYGLNDRGVGLCINELVGSLNHSLHGLPAPFAARGILSQPTFEDAERFVRSVSHASGSNYAIGGSGRVVSFECSARKVEPFVLANHANVTIHTNHPLANDDLIETDVPDPMSNSIIRFESACKLVCEQEAPLTWQSAMTILSSHEDREFPICRHPTPEATSVTCFGIVMECAPRPTLHVTSGPPCITEIRHFGFENAQTASSTSPGN